MIVSKTLFKSAVWTQKWCVWVLKWLGVGMRRRDWNDKSYHMRYKEKYKMKSKTFQTCDGGDYGGGSAVDGSIAA